MKVPIPPLIMSVSTGPSAKAERLNGQVDLCGLGDVELILQRADTPVSLNEETAPHTTVVPLLGAKKDISVSPITLKQAR